MITIEIKTCRNKQMRISRLVSFFGRKGKRSHERKKSKKSETWKQKV